MSNDNEIYPLPENKVVGAEARAITDNYERRSVNERLAPIFKALLDDPDGWELEVEYESGKWKKANRLPISDPNVASSTLDYIRLVRKRKTISVEIPVPDRIAKDGPIDVCALVYYDEHKADEAEETIRSAMEGK